MSAPSTASATPVASLQDVVVRYDDRTVLGPFSLEIAPGSSTALVGPSGCGKSTALRLLAGLERPAEGRVHRAAGRGETAVVFQSPTLAPWSSALDNVALPLRLAGVPAAAAAEQALAALTRVGLAGSERKKPAQLSGGEQQRVAIARALANRPALILADEPTGNLDPVTSTAVFDALKAQVRSEGVTALVATHNLELASHMDRVFAVQSGGLVLRQP